MPITRDLSDLPKATTSNAGDGLIPDAEPRFVHLLAKQWQARNEAEGDRPNAVEGSRFRFSDAAKCARAIAYKAAGIPRSNPMDLSGVWNTSLGTIIHDHWQAALQAEYPDARIEVKVVLDDGEGSGHGDATIVEPDAIWVDVPDDDATPGGAGGFVDKVICFELKTVGGWAFKNAIGKAARGRPAEGPNTSHIVQVALAGRMQNADEVIVGYLAKEALSVGMSKGMPDWSRFCAEWTFRREQYEPIADTEITRIAGILKLVDEGLLASRKVPFETPPGAEIVDPVQSRWEQYDEGRLIDTGTVWNGQMCSYCGWFDTCKQLPSGRIPIEQAVAISTQVVA